MIKWFDVGAEAQGVIAIGQQATGVIAIGQLATGVVAIGQLARGVFVVGQLAAGIVTLGQLSFGVAYNAAMLGVGGTSPGWLVLPLFGRTHDGRFQPHPPAALALRLLALAGLAVAWWLLAGVELWTSIFAQDGVLRPMRQPR